MMKKIELFRKQTNQDGDRDGEIIILNMGIQLGGQSKKCWNQGAGRSELEREKVNFGKGEGGIPGIKIMEA
jgi:hypothetical protein